jgi:hypothetical protein
MTHPPGSTGKLARSDQARKGAVDNYYKYWQDMATLVRKRRNGGQAFFQTVGVSALTTTIALLSFSYQEASQWAVIRNAEALASQVWGHAVRPTGRVPVQAYPPEPVYGLYFREADEARPGPRPLNGAPTAQGRPRGSREPAPGDRFRKKEAQKSALAATGSRTRVRIKRGQRIQKTARRSAPEAAKRAEAVEPHAEEAD